MSQKTAPTLESLAESVDNLTRSVTDLSTMVADLAQAMSDGFAQLNKRMASLESRMDTLEHRMDSLESRMDTLEQTSREHTAAIQELTGRVDTLELHFTGIDDDIKYLYSLIEALKKDLKRGRLTEEDTRSRLEEVEAIARQLSRKVGLKH